MKDNKTDTNPIWQIVDSRAYGGIESHIYYLTRALREHQRGVRVVFVNDYGLHPLEGKLLEKNIAYIKCNGIQDFLKTVGTYQPKILHSHGYKANLICRLAGALYDIPTIASYHAGDCETLRLKLYTALDRNSAFLSQPIAVNTLIANTLTGDAQTIDNFVPLPSHHKELTHIKHIGFVGRLSHEKAPERFIDLAARFPDLQFHIFGDGLLKESLKQDACPNVQFHGHIQDMERVWNSIDILCMPSRKEGLPLAALEAMAHGIPVLAYGAGALPKLIDHDANGWVLPLPDDAQTHTDDMEEALRSLTIPQAKQCGIKARETIHEHYSQQALIPKFIELYDNAMTSPHAPKGASRYAAP